MPLGKLASHHIRGAYPAREPANYKEKTPTSGAFWSSTENDLVLYESLLERQTIMLADFDTNIVGIISQPFRIVALVAGRRRFHTPDYALVHMDGEMEIVNCKPHDHVKKPAVVELHTWVEAVLGQAGLRHRVVSELPSQRATNLAFIAHMRNPRWLMSLPIDVVAAECVEAITLGALVDALAPALDAPTVIACVRALLWIQVLFVDLDAPITLNSLLLVSDA